LTIIYNVKLHVFLRINNAKQLTQINIRNVKMKIKFIKTFATLLLPLSIAATVNASAIKQTKGDFEDKFRQLEEVLPTPNVYRNASGEPGEKYWQQQVDYKIKVSLDEEKRRLTGSEKITYQNNSPYKLKYLWVQLDQNIFKGDSIANMGSNFGGIGRRGPYTGAGDADTPAKMSLGELRRQHFMTDNELGYEISAIKDSRGTK
jgi:predicted secreted protein